MVSLRGKRSVALLATPVLATLVLALGAGCSSDGKGASTSCSTTACTVTFDKGVNAEANILGIKAKLVGVQGSQVTAEVAGQRITVTAGAPVTVGQVQVSVQEITSSKVTLKISQA
jgi:ABC-type Fe3+-hydroxamate transport system substrate-binding protein